MRGQILFKTSDLEPSLGGQVRICHIRTATDGRMHLNEVSIQGEMTALTKPNDVHIELICQELEAPQSLLFRPKINKGDLKHYGDSFRIAPATGKVITD